MSAILMMYLPMIALPSGLADVRIDPAEHLLPLGNPVGRRVVGAVDGDESVARLDVVEQGILLR